MSTIGIVSDTHGLLRPEAIHELQGVELIIHAGDIGKLEVIESLAEIAPVKAVRGNIDQEPWAKQFPEDVVIEVSEKKLYVLHNVKQISLDPITVGFDVVISGHSHKPLIKEEGSVLFVNPGSIGPRRFKLPVAMAKLHIENGEISAEPIQLAI